MLKVNRVYFKCNLRLFTSYLVETYAQHYTVQKDTSTPREVYQGCSLTFSFPDEDREAMVVTINS